MLVHRTLTADRLREVLAYDPVTGLFWWRQPGPGRRPGLPAGGSDGGYGYRVIRVDDVLLPAHRLAWLYVHGSWPDGSLDHVNGDPADNRIVNLRIATQSQNMQNQRLRSDNTSGHLGVTFNKARRKWSAKITVDRRQTYLGLYPTAEAAGAAYRRAKRSLHTFSPVPGERNNP